MDFKHWFALPLTFELVNTLILSDFKSYVKKQMDENNIVRMAKPREEIHVMPEFAKLFKESETIASKNVQFLLLKNKVKDIVNYLDQVASINVKRLKRKTRRDLVKDLNQLSLKRKSYWELKEQKAMFEDLKIMYI